MEKLLLFNIYIQYICFLIIPKYQKVGILHVAYILAIDVLCVVIVRILEGIYITCSICTKNFFHSENGDIMTGSAFNFLLSF